MNGNIPRKAIRSILSVCNLYTERHGGIRVLPRDRPFIGILMSAESIVDRTSPTITPYGILILCRVCSDSSFRIQIN